MKDVNTMQLKELVDLLDQTLAELIVIQLSSMGIDLITECSLDEVMAAHAILPRYRRWLEETRSVINGTQARLNNEHSQDTSQNSWDRWSEIKQVGLRQPSLRAQLMLLEKTVPVLPDILTGNIKATDVIFPGSSMALVEGIYKNNPTADHCNLVLANLLVTYVKAVVHTEPDRKVRILEIGAGTGGTSEPVFQALENYQDHIAEYCYTDVSKAFLLHAEEKYGEHVPYLQYKLFDVSRSAQEQDFKLGHYDIVIAANVIHASTSINKSLRHAKSLLGRNGLLLLNEMTEPDISAHLTFGLLEGWWLYEDEEIRQRGCPFLSRNSWVEVLEQAGFYSTKTLPEKFDGLGQEVIASLSDGVIHQKQDRALSVGSESTSIDRKVDTKAVKTSQLSMGMQEKLTETIVAQLARAIKVSTTQININVPFADYGLDSILGIKVVEGINRLLHCDLNPSVLFDYTTVVQLRDYIADQYGAELDEDFNLGKNDDINEPQPTVVLEKVSPIQPIKIAPSQKQYNVTTDEPVTPIKEREISSDSGNRHNDIAVIGMSGKFPEADDINEYWDNIIQKKSAIKDLPEHYYLHGRADGEASAKGGTLKEKDNFDPIFFSLSPWEAKSMHPHQRLILQEGWKAIEDAGYNPRTLSDSRTGIFIGSEPIAHSSETFAGSSEAIIASRLSYLLNLNGPALVVNTGCSSSAVAIHLACESIRNDESEMAIAGGVYASLNDTVFNTLSSIGMVSPKGECNTFDASADGTVLSEAVGIVVLKSLGQAVDDGDNILGIIEASAMNQDGTSNGITAPSGKAQERLIKSTYDRFGIDPLGISAVEVHGTGTELGDPIEANSLARAYNAFTKKEGYCAISSAKSYIGHTAAAAGVVGLITQLQAIKAKKIPGIRHLDKLNPMIQLERSAFTCEALTRDWVVEAGQPRRVALNSFGHSGTNVHMVIREYLPSGESVAHSKPSEKSNTFVFPVSAKDQERLVASVRNLACYCEELLVESDEQDLLSRISYTLQTGREAMASRAFVVANSLESLQLGFRHLETLLLAEEQRWAGDLNEVTSKKVSVTELENWLSGGSIDWLSLYGATKPRRVSLPTYPFEEICFRSSVSPISITSETLSPQPFHIVGNLVGDEKLHPLIHKNISTFDRQCFLSTFNGSEAFLDQHRLHGNAVLPGVAYIEMVREAITQSLSADVMPNSRLTINNLVWLKPAVLQGEDLVLQLAIYFEDQTYQFEFFSEPDGSGLQKVIHCRGAANLLNSSLPSNSLNIEEVKHSLRPAQHSIDNYYQQFSDMGVHYGPSFRSLKELWSDKNQVLATIALPDGISGAVDTTLLPPYLLDAAFQAAFGLAFENEDTHSADTAFVPFSVDKIEIVKPCTTTVWARIKKVRTAGSSDYADAEGFQTLDIEVFGSDGELCIAFTELVMRKIELETNGAVTQLLVPEWVESPVQVGHSATACERVVLLCGFSRNQQQQIEMLNSRLESQSTLPVLCQQLMSDGDNIDLAYQYYACRVFEHIKSYMRSDVANNVLLQLVVPSSLDVTYLSGLSSLLKTASKETPNFLGEFITVHERSDDVIDTEQLVSVLQANGRAPISEESDYSLGIRRVKTWVDSTIDPLDKAPLSNSLLKENGVYFISGGSGGLSEIVVRNILQRAKSITVILCGRRAADQRIQELVSALSTSGSNVYYEQLDITDKSAVEQVLNKVLAAHGSVDGIIHSAGVVNDNFILNKSVQEFSSVLAPKVSGLVNLDEASQSIPLDFFIAFSSLTGELGNVGQADYAAANGFMDAYMRGREKRVNAGERFGNSLSINWPLWKSTGMSVDKAVQASLFDELGVVPMTEASGLAALDCSFQLARSQVMVIHGDVAKIKGHLNGKTAPSVKAISSGDFSVGLLEQTQQLLIQTLSAQIHYPADRIDVDATLDTYGIDSTTVLGMTAALEDQFGRLPKTLFFEYQTLAGLAGYFVKFHSDTIGQLFSIDSNEAEVLTESTPLNPSGMTMESAEKRTKKMNADKLTQGIRDTDIAVIGLAGRYPNANTLEEYWDNLASGKDCISEIPKDRWDYQTYFSEDKDEKGKTYCKWGGFVDDYECFDAKFFSISPRDALNMDPQERLFLECVHETIEDAGYTRDNVSSSGNVAVYAGVMYEEFQLFGYHSEAEGNGYALPVNSASVANRVSYHFDFHGASMTVNTMCSSSLSSIHLACRDLVQGDSEVAIAGGVNLSMHPNKYFLLAQGRFASSTGQCTSFGVGGDGYVPGEGVGSVLLKPLAKAVEDNDHIYGVIKASAVNHGGKTNGYSVPNPNAQGELIQRVIERAGVDPTQISYIEAHGTGTALGDPIEVAGLSNAFNAKGAEANQFCAIGSVKSNIGHCESAAGIAGLTKVLLQLKHKKLVPSLHSQALNENIDFEQTPFYVQRELSDWKTPVDLSRPEQPRRLAGLSSFGAGGSNAHLIIEEYIPSIALPVDVVVEDQQKYIIPLTSKTLNGLLNQVERLKNALTGFHNDQLRDIAYTLQCGRESYAYRLAMVVEDIRDIRMQLDICLVNRDAIVSQNTIADSKDLYYSEVDLISGSQRVSGKIQPIGKAQVLAQKWVEGACVEWRNLYSDLKPQRVSLPTYAFDRVSYWTTTPGRKEAPSRTLAQPSTAGRPVSEKQQSVTTNVKHTAGKVGLRSLTETPLINASENEHKPHQVSLKGTDASAIESEPEQTTQGVKLSLIGNATPDGSVPEPELPAKTELKDSTAKPALKGPGVAELVRQLKQTLADALYMEVEEVNVSAEFIDLGLDSIVGVEWLNEVNNQYSLDIRATALYDYPSIRKFAEFLNGEIEAGLQGSGDDDQQSVEDQIIEDKVIEDVKTDSIEEASTDNTREAAAAISNEGDNNEKHQVLSLSLTQVRAVLKETLAEALYMEIDEINANAQFVDLGLDSIVGVEWVSELNTALGIELTASILYDHPCIADLAEHLCKAPTVNVAAEPETENADVPVVKGRESSVVPFPTKQAQAVQQNALTLEELLDKVKAGDIDIDEANRLLGEVLGVQNER